MDGSNSNTSAPADSAMSAGEFLTTEILIGIAAGIGGILLILLIVIVWLCYRNSKNNITDDTKKKEAVDGGGTDANENIPEERNKLLESGANTGGGHKDSSGGDTAGPSTPIPDMNMESMLGMYC